MIATAPSRQRRLLVPLLLTAALWAVPAVAQQAEESVGLDPLARRYELGQGLRLGQGFALGGYGVASAADQNEDGPRFALDGLSAMLWWDSGGHWHFFSETELKNAIAAGGGSSDDEAEVELERLYLDYAHDDRLKLRLGKFLTPVGRWNLIHAAPLVWTTSRPLITEATFPTNATGAMLYGLLPWGTDGLEYSLYASPGTELAPEDGVDTFEEAYGGHLGFTPLQPLQLGLSYVDFELRDSPEQRRRLYGLDFFWSRRRFELSGEFHYRVTSSRLEGRDEQGLYLQAVAPLGARLYAVARYESFRDSDAARSLNLYLGGLAWRMRPGLVFKAEFSSATDHDLDVQDGLMASVAVLF